VKDRLFRGLAGWLAGRGGKAPPPPDAGDIALRLAGPGLHEPRIAALFAGATRFEGPGPVLPCPLVMVAFTNRCGSNLLCDYLAQTGRMAVAGESLNHDTVAIQHAQHGGTGFPDHVAGLATRLGAAAGRPLAVKASLDQLAMLLRWNITAMFPHIHVIHIRRRDALAQAVSLSVASQTGRWTSQQQGKPVTPEWRPEEIRRILTGLRLENQGIGILAAAAGLPLREIAYEDMVADPAGHLRAALRFCGLDPGGWTPAPPSIDRQDDADKSAILTLARAAMRQALLGPGPDTRP
jgi:trehalose 2-sulfotransferase